jgi:hypothetical protein
MRSESAALRESLRDIDTEGRTPCPEKLVGILEAKRSMEEAGWIVLASGFVEESDDFKSLN